MSWKTDGIDPKIKEAIISEYINSSQGRAKLAASMIQPLRGIRNPMHKCKLCGELCYEDHSNEAECEVAKVIDS